MAKKQVKYITTRGFENDKARHEAETAVSAAQLKKDGFTVKYLQERGIIKIEGGTDGNRKNK